VKEAAGDEPKLKRQLQQRESTKNTFLFFFFNFWWELILL